MKRFRQFFAVCMLLLPLTISAETVSWTPATTFTDGSTIPAATMSTMTYYLRVWKAGAVTRTYLGETHNGVASWTDNILVRANANGISPQLVPGDNVLVSLSQAYKASDGVEYDSAQSTGYAYMIPKPVPPPPVKPPSCNAPTGITIR